MAFKSLLNKMGLVEDDIPVTKSKVVQAPAQATPTSFSAATTAATAAAYAADAYASPAKKAKWKAVKDECNASAIETLRLACAISKQAPKDNSEGDK